jgi:hypothetical protein
MSVRASAHRQSRGVTPGDTTTGTADEVLQVSASCAALSLHPRPDPQPLPVPPSSPQRQPASRDRLCRRAKSTDRIPLGGAAMVESVTKSGQLALRTVSGNLDKKPMRRRCCARAADASAAAASPIGRSRSRRLTQPPRRRGRFNPSERAYRLTRSALLPRDTSGYEQWLRLRHLQNCPICIAYLRPMVSAQRGAVGSCGWRMDCRQHRRGGCAIGAARPRVRGDLQPSGEVLLQICCRCSDGHLQIQFMIAIAPAKGRLGMASG